METYSWEVIDANGEEETRQVLNDECLTSLYEVTKLAYLEPIKAVPFGCLKIKSNVAYGFVSLSIQNSVFVFGEGCSSLILNITLENVLEVMVWLPGGKFLLLGDSVGVLHCLHIQSKKIIFSKKLNLEKKSTLIEGKAFITSAGTTVVLITLRGEIIQLDYIDQDDLDEGLQLQDIPFLNSLKSKISLSKCSVPVDALEVLCAEALLFESSTLCVWLSTAKGIYSWTSGTIFSEISNWYYYCTSYPCTKLIQLMNGRYLVALNEEQNLQIFSGDSGIELWNGSHDEELNKLSVIAIQRLSSDDYSTQLLVLTQNEEDCSFSTLSIPNFEWTHLVSVNNSIIPLSLGNEADSITYLEPKFEHSSSDLLLHFKLKNIVDGMPETRLLKLLKKHKFNEAEEFCETFGLDLGEVLEAKAKYLCELLSPWRSPSSCSTVFDVGRSSEHMEDLMLTLNRIMDVNFVSTLCLNAPMADVHTTNQLLLYAKERLAKSAQKGERDEMSFLMQRVSKTLYCLSTFHSLFPSGDIQSWLSFERANMFGEFLKHLKRGNLDISATIWHRHLYEFQSDLDEEKIREILNAIPFGILSDRLCIWVANHLLKDFILICPSCIEIIADWTDDRIKSLEISEKERWPANALQLATMAINVIENVAEDFYGGGNIEVQVAVHMAHWKSHSPSSHLYHLRKTALALRDLQTLAHKYSIVIKFKDYIQEDKQSVVIALLDWLVSGEEVEPLAKGFLGNFVLQHNMKLDEILETYVMECLASSDYEWWMQDEAPWEDKVYAVIKVIYDIHVKVRCIVKCVHMASVPWSKGTREMCSYAMGLNTTYTKSLHEQERLAKLKIVLRRYSLHRMNYENRQSGKLILKNIVSYDGDTVLEDALSVVSAFDSVNQIDAYYFRTLHLLNVEKYPKARELIMNLNVEDRRSLCYRVTQHVEKQVNIPPINLKCRQNLIIVTSNFLALENTFRENVSAKYGVLEGVFEKIRSLNALTVKYNLFLTLNDLDDQQVCLSTLKQFIVQKLEAKKIGSNMNRTGVASATHSVLLKDQRTLEANSFKGDDQKETIGNLIWELMNPIRHIAALMGISRQQLFTFLISHANSHGFFATAVQLAKELCERIKPSFLTEVVFELVEASLSFNYVEENEDALLLRQNLTNLIIHVFSSSLIFCHPRHFSVLNEYLMLYKVSEALLDQCHCKAIYFNTSAVTSTSTQSLKKWTLSPVYTDAGLPLDEKIVNEVLHKILKRLHEVHPGMPLLQNCAFNLNLELNYSDIYYVDETRDAMSQLILHLRERNQHVLALFISQNTCTSLRLGGLGDDVVFDVLKVDIGTMLMGLLNSKQCDLAFAISLLSHFKVKEALNALAGVIKKLGHDYPRLLKVGEIGYELCQIMKLPQVGCQFSLLMVRASWGIQLEEIGINFMNGFSGDKVALEANLDDLTSRKECSFSLLQKFCHDFSWDATDAHLRLLKSTIRKWTPDFEVISLNGAYQEVPSTVIIKIDKIISKIDCKIDLVKVLKEEFNAMSAYNYEMLDVLLSFLASNDESFQEKSVKGKEILNFLKEYKRICPLGNYEKENYFHKFNSDFHILAKFRLPFHELYNKTRSTMKEIVEKEVFKETVAKWIQISSVIGILKDRLYYTATQNTIAALLDKKLKSNMEWEVHSTNKDTLSDVHFMISKIEHPELATACANWVFMQLPGGADKVEAARKCYHLAKAFHSKDGSKEFLSKQECQKFMQRYKVIATEHVLHKYSLASPQYLNLKSDPEGLIISLYEHPCLSTLVTLNTEHVINIDGCVSEICAVNGLNQTAIQSKLISNWLPLQRNSSAADEDEDETISNFKLCFDQKSSLDHSSSLCDVQLSRLIYLLRCYPKEQAVSYLLEQALNKDGEVVTSVRLKAIRCLLAIADRETIEKQSYHSMDEIRKLLQTLTYVNRLGLLGHEISESAIIAMDKEALVEGIWKSQRYNPEALLLIVDICHDYKILTASLWEALFSQLTNFVEAGNLTIFTLEKVLLKIRNVPHLWVLPSVCGAWELVIYYPFKKANLPLTEECWKNCVHSVNLTMQCCPIDIELENLIELCLGLRIPILALTLASKSHYKDQYMKDILEKYSSEELSQQYERLKTLLALPQNIEDLLKNCRRES